MDIIKFRGIEFKLKDIILPGVLKRHWDIFFGNVAHYICMSQEGKYEEKYNRVFSEGIDFLEKSFETYFHKKLVKEQKKDLPWDYLYSLLPKNNLEFLQLDKITRPVFDEYKEESLTNFFSNTIKGIKSWIENPDLIIENMEESTRIRNIFYKLDDIYTSKTSYHVPRCGGGRRFAFSV